MAHAAVPNPANSRTRLLVFPREHGAWGILFVPLGTAAAAGLLAGGTAAPLVPLIVTVFALFCLRTPVESLLGTAPVKAQGPAEKRLVCLYAAGFAGVTGVGLVVLLRNGRNPGLLLLGALAGLLFLLQTLLRRLGRKGRMGAQLAGSVGLTISGPAAYYVVTGRLGLAALGLWLANWIFAANQIHFVQLCIRGAKLSALREKMAFGRMFLAFQPGMWGVLAVACHLRLLPWLTLAAFIPVFVRGLAWFAQTGERLDVHRLGLVELAHGLAFGVLLVAAYAV
jgi:hypothetical protein